MKELNFPLSAEKKANYFITGILISCISVVQGATKASIDRANSLCETFHRKSYASY